MENQKQEAVTQVKQRKTLRYILPILVVILLAGFAYFGLAGSVKEEISRQKQSKEAASAIKQYENFLSDYEKTLAADTYGGKTPQETLNMFISALEANDLELAGKYFALDKNLSRKYGEDGLKAASENKQIPFIVKELKKA